MSTASSEVETPKVQPRYPSRPHPLLNLCVGRALVVLRQKGSNSVIAGRCKWYRNGFLKLTEATIQPPQQPSYQVPWVLVEIQTIAHVHPDLTPALNAPEAKTGETL